VLDIESADEVMLVATPASGLVLDVFWSRRGALVRRVADQVEEFACTEVRGTPVRWEELDLATGSWTALDDVGALQAARFREFTGGIDIACGPDEPVHWTGGVPDCPTGSDSIGFYFEGVALDAVNPRFVVGVYEP
jgi:hypothetical protein